MTEREKRLWSAAKNDSEFKKTLKEADGDSIPFFADKLDKVLIISIYYGYLIAKHGKNWESTLDK
jgi:hypothetical protein